MAWRSNEMAHNMRQSSEQARERNNSKIAANDSKVPDHAARKRMVTDVVLEQELESIGDKLGDSIVSRCEDEEGELDLRNLSGEEAMKFMNAMNLRMGRD